MIIDAHAHVTGPMDMYEHFRQRSIGQYADEP